MSAHYGHQVVPMPTGERIQASHECLTIRKSARLVLIGKLGYHPPPTERGLSAQCGFAAMDYHLKPIGKTCAGTGEELIPGSRCYSVVIDHDGQRVRLDYSEAGWQGPPTGAIGHWTSTVPLPETTKTKPLDADALMRYFEQMSEDANPVQEKFKYVLALLLLQKRRLQLDGSRHDGDIEYLEVSGNRGEGPYEVRHFELSDDETEQLQRDLNTHLKSEWN